MVTCFPIRARFLSCAQLAHLCFVPCHHAAVTPLLPLMAIFFANLTGFSAPIRNRQTPSVLISRTYQRAYCLCGMSEQTIGQLESSKVDGWTDGRVLLAASAAALRHCGAWDLR
ncbi:hypothetical protein BKA80DRAFT_60221 [Phyllosticta citrichinensis]